MFISELPQVIGAGLVISPKKQHLTSLSPGSLYSLKPDAIHPKQSFYDRCDSPVLSRKVRVLESSAETIFLILDELPNTDDIALQRVLVENSR